MPANRGHGFHVRAGRTFRFEMIEGAQILDVDLFAAHDPTEHYSAATQLWLAGTVPNTCYDNLRAGCAMVGLGQRAIHNNLNVYMKAAMDPRTGQHLNVVSDASRGDYIQFFAELDLLVVVSLCPYGDGAVVPSDWATTPIVQRPIAIEIADSGTLPLGWP